MKSSGSAERVVEPERLVAGHDRAAGAAARSSTSSRRGSPPVSTASNRSSSLRITCTTASRLALQLRDRRRPSRDEHVDQRVQERLASMPSCLPCRIARRMILRST